LRETQRSGKLTLAAAADGTSTFCCIVKFGGKVLEPPFEDAIEIGLC
jgi:hypothetical protein